MRTDVRLALAAHVLLAGSMALARALEAVASASGGAAWWNAFAAEVALAAWALVLVAALCVAAFATLRARHPILIVLAVLLSLSLAQRRTFDLFDLVYLLAVALAGAFWAAGTASATVEAGRGSRAGP